MAHPRPGGSARPRLGDGGVDGGSGSRCRMARKGRLPTSGRAACGRAWWRVIGLDLLDNLPAVDDRSNERQILPVQCAGDGDAAHIGVGSVDSACGRAVFLKRQRARQDWMDTRYRTGIVGIGISR